MNVVTGSVGFIGSNLVRALDGPTKGIDRGDPLILKDATVVYHLAARVGATQHNPVEFCRDNVMWTARLLEAMPPSVEHMVLASSCVAMFGGTPYAATKAAQEDLCATWCEHHGITLSILRLHAVYGPGQGDGGTYEGVVAKFAHALLRGDAPVVDDDGLQVRDFVHVDDVVRAMVQAADARFDGVCEIGTGRPTAILDVAQRLQAYLGGPEPVVTGVARPGTPNTIVADRAQVHFVERSFDTWEPQVSFDVGLAAYARSLREKAAVA